ncbi:MAG: hypothetical protein LBR81_05330 [Prevotellaceae bacterium]|jgi:hypothetical protein|nr:hypothetical protein [Prevotellaceae bacterium]
MKLVRLTIGWQKIVLLSFFFFMLGTQAGYTQDRATKVLTIIDSLGMVKTQKMLFDMRLEPLKYRITVEEDGTKLNEIEKLLTEEEIQKRIIRAFDALFTDEEVNVVYDFITSTACNKLSSLMSDGIPAQFKDINEELDGISRHIHESELDPKFEAIPVEREDGFYATVNYDSNENITLEEKPAITKEDILEVVKNAENTGVDIIFDTDGARKFYTLTKDNTGLPVAVVVDKYIISLPVVYGAISSGRATISGNFSEEELENMVKKLTPDLP